MRPGNRLACISVLRKEQARSMPRSSAGRTYRHERRLGGGVVLAVEGPSALIQQILNCDSRVERHVTVRLGE